MDIGECLCKREQEDSCLGSGCFRELGLSWYGPSCKDCRCKKVEEKHVVIPKKRYVDVSRLPMSIVSAFGESASLNHQPVATEETVGQILNRLHLCFGNAHLPKTMKQTQSTSIRFTYLKNIFLSTHQHLIVHSRSPKRENVHTSHESTVQCCTSIMTQQDQGKPQEQKTPKKKTGRNGPDKLMQNMSIEELEGEMKRLRRTIDGEETTKHILVAGTSFLVALALMVRLTHVMADIS